MSGCRHHLWTKARLQYELSCSCSRPTGPHSMPPDRLQTSGGGELAGERQGGPGCCFRRCRFPRVRYVRWGAGPPPAGPVQLLRIHGGPAASSGSGRVLGGHGCSMHRCAAALPPPLGQPVPPTTLASVAAATRGCPHGGCFCCHCMLALASRAGRLATVLYVLVACVPMAAPLCTHVPPPRARHPAAPRRLRLFQLWPTSLPYVLYFFSTSKILFFSHLNWNRRP